MVTSKEAESAVGELWETETVVEEEEVMGGWEERSERSLRRRASARWLEEYI